MRNVQFIVGDLADTRLPAADLVVANLTGALLVREATALLGAVDGSGFLVVSGILDSEEEAVGRAFCDAELRRRDREGEWVCLTFNLKVSSTV